MGVASALKSFVAIVTTLGVAAGTHKYVDEEKVRNVLQQDCVLLTISKFHEEDSCVDMLRKNASSLKESVKLSPVIIDKSGYFKGESLFDIDIYYDASNCTSKKENTTYKVSPKQTNSSKDLQLTFNPREYRLKKMQDGYELKPSVEILTRSFNKFFPEGRYEDSNLLVVLKNIVLDSPDKVSFKVEISNKSRQFVKVERLSFYINNSILSQVVFHAELAPGAVDDFELYSVRSSTSSKEASIFDNAARALYIKTSRSLAPRMSLDLGVSAKYLIDNATKSFHQSKSYKLSGIIRN